MLFDFLNDLLNMEALEEVVKILMGGSLTFVGLIFTSLGIILTMQDNWKTRTLRKSEEFNAFLNQNVLCIISSILIFILSILLLLIKDIENYDFFASFILICLTFLTILVCYYAIRIVFNYKTLIQLKNDDTKPIFSCQHNEGDEGD